MCMPGQIVNCLFKHRTLKVEYHANENPLKDSEKNSICWSKVNVYNNKKKTPYHASFILIAIMFLGFYNKNGSFYRKYIAKITNPITKPQFLTIIKLTYTGIK